MEPGPEQPISSLSAGYVEELYAQYLADPQSVDADWRTYFAGLNGAGDATQLQLGPSFRSRSIWNPAGTGSNGATPAAPAAAPAGPAAGVQVERRRDGLQDKVDKLVRNFRVRGHLIAQLDPLELPRPPQPELEPEFYGITQQDLERTCALETVNGRELLPVRELIERMHNTYCRTVGVQFYHIDEYEPKQWLQERMEATGNRKTLSREEQLRMLTMLTDAVIFEDFLQKKFIGKKRFSLEGSESLLPLMQLAIDKAAEQGVRGIVIGMSHRGRLNVLSNIIGMSAQEIFQEFEGTSPDYELRPGDVKYHLGHSTNWIAADGREVYLSLCFNPSHLEYVNPVVLGRVRAEQDRYGDTAREHGLGIIVHGDAAFAGEGIVQETLNLSQLRGYTVGGALHVIVNNQVGFTTSPEDGRSSLYASGVAKMLQSPIFHVNGEDPEAVAQVVDLAMDFRRTWHRDVVIDLYGYRKWGHNESDEPSFTQPLMYDVIRKRKSVREGYLDYLLQLGGVTREQADQLAERRRMALDADLSEFHKNKRVEPAGISEVWSQFQGGLEKGVPEADTAVPKEKLVKLLGQLANVPAGFTPHPNLVKQFLAKRQLMVTGEAPLDWSAGEMLAYATLATQGIRVRMSGQDVERGTFSHRHGVLHDYKTGEQYLPLSQLAPDQAPVEIYNSPLSEAGVMGFEFGYSLNYPDALVLWEAQFGDFCNAAQVIIDQFLASCEEKWRYLSGLTLLLPHGFDGIGPEHSSARLERFLMLAARDNLQVANVTTPAQMFHLLRRQVLRRWRKPLVIMTPKGLLRHPLAVSTLEELASGSFQRILPDAPLGQAQRPASLVMLCSGKVYFDLLERRAADQREDVAILRFEQLYPLADGAIAQALSPYAEGTPLLWVQEEPVNMGAWPYLRLRAGAQLLGRYPLSVVARPESASPATGSEYMHKIEQQRLVDEAFGFSYALPESVQPEPRRVAATGRVVR